VAEPRARKSSRESQLSPLHSGPSASQLCRTQSAKTARQHLVLAFSRLRMNNLRRIGQHDFRFGIFPPVTSPRQPIFFTIFGAAAHAFGLVRRANMSFCHFFQFPASNSRSPPSAVLRVGISILYMEVIFRAAPAGPAGKTSASVSVTLPEVGILRHSVDIPRISAFSATSLLQIFAEKSRASTRAPWPQQPPRPLLATLTSRAFIGRLTGSFVTMFPRSTPASSSKSFQISAHHPSWPVVIPPSFRRRDLTIFEIFFSPRRNKSHPVLSLPYEAALLTPWPISTLHTRFHTPPECLTQTACAHRPVDFFLRAWLGLTPHRNVVATLQNSPIVPLQAPHALSLSFFPVRGTSTLAKADSNRHDGT